MWKIGSFFAKAISVFLQPYLMPLYSVALLFVYTNFYSIEIEQILRFLLPVFMFSFLLPSMFTLILWKLKYIENLKLTDQNDRILPYIIFMSSNISLTYFFYTAGVYFWFLGLVAAPVIIALVALLINFFWKISAHMLGIGGVVGGVLSVCMNVKAANPYLLFAILFVVSGFLAVCRLYLKRNTPAQIYVGFLIGLALAYGSVSLGVFAPLISLKLGFG